MLTWTENEQRRKEFDTGNHGKTNCRIKEEIHKLVENQKSLECDQSLSNDKYKFVAPVYTLVNDLIVKSCS